MDDHNRGELTRQLIGKAIREIEELNKLIEATRVTIDRSRELLSRVRERKSDGR